MTGNPPDQIRWPLIASSIEFPAGDGYYDPVLDALVVTQPHLHLWQHEVAHRLSAHSLRDPGVFAIARKFTAMSHMVLWLTLMLCADEHIRIAGRSLSEFSVEGGSEPSRKRVSTVLANLRVIEQKITECFGNARFAAELAAIDFAETVYRIRSLWQSGGNPDTGTMAAASGYVVAWELRRRRDIPIAESIYTRGQKQELLGRVVSAQVRNLGLDASARAELEQTWRLYDSIEDDSLRQQVLILCMGSVSFDVNAGLAPRVLHPIYLVPALVRLLEQHGSEAAYAYVNEIGDEIQQETSKVLEYLDNIVQTQLPSAVHWAGQFVDVAFKCVESQRLACDRHGNMNLSNLCTAGQSAAYLLGFDPDRPETFSRLHRPADPGVWAKLDRLYQDANGADRSLLRWWQEDGSLRARFNSTMLSNAATLLGKDTALASSWIRYLLFFAALRNALVSERPLVCPLNGFRLSALRLGDFVETEIPCTEDCIMREWFRLTRNCFNFVSRNPICVFDD